MVAKSRSAAKPKRDPAAALLAKHKTRGYNTCTTCKEPYKSSLERLLHCAIETGQQVTLAQLRACMEEDCDYQLSTASLSNHLRRCQPALAARANFARLGGE